MDHAVNFSHVQQSVNNRRQIEHKLVLRQEPQRSRMCGIGEKADRRPVDPPPIIQLHVSDPSTAHNRVYLHNPYYFMYATLMDENGEHELNTLSDKKARTMTGSVVASLSHLKDVDGSDGAFFVFPDLSVRCEGVYRLKFSLYEIVGNQVFFCKSITSETFTVFSAKKFPGMEESTPLTKLFAEQGLKIRVRKEQKSTRPKTTSRSRPLATAHFPESSNSNLSKGRPPNPAASASWGGGGGGGGSGGSHPHQHQQQRTVGPIGHNMSYHHHHPPSAAHGHPNSTKPQSMSPHAQLWNNGGGGNDPIYSQSPPPPSESSSYMGYKAVHSYHQHPPPYTQHQQRHYQIRQPDSASSSSAGGSQLHYCRDYQQQQPYPPSTSSYNQQQSRYRFDSQQNPWNQYHHHHQQQQQQQQQQQHQQRLPTYPGHQYSLAESRFSPYNRHPYPDTVKDERRRHVSPNVHIPSLVNSKDKAPITPGYVENSRPSSDHFYASHTQQQQPQDHSQRYHQLAPVDPQSSIGNSSGGDSTSYLGPLPRLQPPTQQQLPGTTYSSDKAILSATTATPPSIQQHRIAVRSLLISDSPPSPEGETKK